MNARTLPALGCALLMNAVALADASYQESTQITGGTLVGTVKSSPFMPKQLKKIFEPINSLTMTHGDQLAVVSATSTQIIDLDQQTITRIDNDKKTYTVTSFDEMRQAFKDAPKKLEQAQAQMKQAQERPGAPNSQTPQLQVTFEVSVVDTGASKVVNGQMSKEQVFTLKTHVTDPNADPHQAGGNTMTYNYVTDIWTTPDPREVKEIQDFYGRYAKKLMEGVDATALMTAMRPAVNGSGLGALFVGNPGMGSALQEMMKKMATEMSKVKGTRVLEITQLGGDTNLTTASVANAGSSPSAGAENQSVSQAATDTAASQAGSRFGSLGSALARSAMGAFGHAASKPTDLPATAAAGAAAPASSVMYETTTQKSNFSQAAISPEAFRVPNGYRKMTLAPLNGAAPTQ